MQINECAERFFREFADEHETFFATKWRGKRESESRLDYVLDCASAKTLREGFRYKLIAYYVGVRHATVHPPSESDLAVLERSRLRVVKEHAADIGAWFQSQGLPNGFDKIGFTDYKLFIRALQEFAHELSEITRPSDEILAEIAFRATLDNGDDRVARATSRACQYMQTQFGLEVAEANAIARYHAPGPIAQR